MPSSTNVILLVIFTAIVIISFWNTYNLNQIKKRASVRNTPLDDAKYWELKSKQEFLIAVVTLITAVIAYLGYNSKKDIEKDVKASLQGKIDTVAREIEGRFKPIKDKTTEFELSLKAAEQKIGNADLQIEAYKQELLRISNQQKEVKTLSISSANQADTILKRIATINKNNILKQQIYIVKHPGVGANGAVTTAKFIDLKTILGDKLPLFKTPPIIVPIAAIPVVAYNVSNEEFSMLRYNTNGFPYKSVVDGKIPVTVMIYEVP